MANEISFDVHAAMESGEFENDGQVYHFVRARRPHKGEGPLYVEWTTECVHCSRTLKFSTGSTIGKFPQMHRPCYLKATGADPAGRKDRRAAAARGKRAAAKSAGEPNEYQRRKTQALASDAPAEDPWWVRDERVYQERLDEAEEREATGFNDGESVGRIQAELWEHWIERLENEAYSSIEEAREIKRRLNPDVLDVLPDEVVDDMDVTAVLAAHPSP